MVPLPQRMRRCAANPCCAAGGTAARHRASDAAARAAQRHDPCERMGASPDAIVIGAGPNGLSAAVALAQAGRSVTVYEALDTIGGGASSAPLTLPGFLHDVCSAVHPVAVASPYWR